MQLLDFLFPPRCEGCGRLGKYICERCVLTIQFRDQCCPECDRPAIDGITHPGCQRAYGLDGLTTVFNYSRVIKKVLKTIKYRFVYDEAETLINLIPVVTWRLLNNLVKDYSIYPIPLHKDRLNWRGFNQAEKLAKLISQKLQLPLIDKLLIRTEHRTPQADISHRTDRIRNAQGLFTLSSRFPEFKALNSGNLNSILLVDDVWTTGATMKEATKVLKRNGIKHVWGMTLAR